MAAPAVSAADADEQRLMVKILSGGPEVFPVYAADAS
jgi:hypothetical protein